MKGNPFPDLNEASVREEVIRYDSMPYKHYLKKHENWRAKTLKTFNCYETYLFIHYNFSFVSNLYGVS